MKLKSPLMATALASLANGQTPATAIITVEASHGGAGSGLTNTTLSIPLLTQYTNPALDAVSTLYLIGSNGNVKFPSITCYPYRNGNLTGMGGLPFTSETPSRLSTNTVQVGSIVCNSTDLTAGNAASATSTLSATTTDLTRGSTSDVPNLNGTTALSVTSSSLGSNSTMTPTSTMRTTVSATSTGGAAQETVTSVTVVTGGGGGPVTSTMVSAVRVAPSSSPADMSNGGSQTGQTGAAGERWRVERWGVVAAVIGVVLSAV